MLIEFSVANFRSIAEKQAFSFVANTSKDDGEHQVFTPSETKTSLLKSAVLYGANAAGKSNLIKAMQTMKEIVRTSSREKQRGDSLPVIPFKLDTALSSEPTEFEVIFIAEGVRYQYGFTATEQQIMEEWLFAYPKGRAQSWFSRVWISDQQGYDWSFGSSFLGEKQAWKNATRNNALFLSTAVQLNSEQLKPVFDWFNVTLRFIGVDGIDETFSAYYCEKYSKKEVLDFLKCADVGIDGIDIQEQPFNPALLPDGFPSEIKSRVLEELKDKQVLEVKTTHKDRFGNMINFELDDESTGTQKVFAFAGPWLDVLKHGYILVVDELHDNLHPKLVHFLVEQFHNPKTNPHNAQLFFTTHETSILNQEVFRRDQIWFCEKNHKATHLYPLTDFSPRKDRENLEVSYLNGRYGALPMVQLYSKKVEVQTQDKQEAEAQHGD